jgi:hypothetical protein
MFASASAGGMFPMGSRRRRLLQQWPLSAKEIDGFDPYAGYRIMGWTGQESFAP